MHRTTRKRRRPVWDEEEAFRRFNEVIDFELYCLELEYSDKIGAMIREGVKRRLDEKQKAFEAMLAQHPATLAENARRAETRRLEKERLEKIAERQSEREERRRCAGVRYLARRWHAKLAPAHAS
jgi:hypothetical protein